MDYSMPSLDYSKTQRKQNFSETKDKEFINFSGRSLSNLVIWYIDIYSNIHESIGNKLIGQSGRLITVYALAAIIFSRYPQHYNNSNAK